MNQLVSYFLPGENLSSTSARKARLLIRFYLISIAFAIGYFLNTYATGFIMARYLMVAATILFILTLLALKHGILGLRWTSWIFIWLCWLVVFVLSFFSGGIKSYVLPWIALIPVVALALANGRTALLWGIAGLLGVILFFNLDVQSLVPAHLTMQPNNMLIASLNVGLQFLLLSVVYVFERQQNRLIGQLEEAGKIIEQQNEKLLMKNEVLESEISKRTSQLVSYNQQLEQFAFMASHNLRAPIARLIGLSNIYKESHGNDQEFIRNKMIDATQELDQIVRDINLILDIQKNRETSYSKIKVFEEINQVISTLKREIETTQSHVQIQVDKQLTMSCIKPYFQSIVYNLVSNAIKYRKPDESAVIKVQVSEMNNFVVLTVADNGLGIDLNSSGEKMFSLYSRFHEGYDGKGIGLYMVKIQSEAMGGLVQVESKPGEGSVFTVQISQ